MAFENSTGTNTRGCHPCYSLRTPLYLIPILSLKEACLKAMGQPIEFDFLRINCDVTKEVTYEASKCIYKWWVTGTRHFFETAYLDPRVFSPVGIIGGYPGKVHCLPR